MSYSCEIKEGTSLLVTGASGFTGSVLARKLVACGCRVRTIIEPGGSVENLKDLDIEMFHGNIYDEDVVKKASDGVEYIFHIAAVFRVAGIPDEVYHRVHVIGTQLLAKQAASNPDFKRFIHISTGGVHGDIKNPPADENYPFQPGDIYQRTKAEAEKWLHDFALKSGLSYTVIRPAAIYGPGDRRLFKLFKMASKRFFPFLGWGKGLYHLIHVEDLTDIILLSATHPRASGQVFIAGNPEPVSILSMGQIIAKVYGNKSTVIRLPVWPFFVMGFLCEMICIPLRIEPPIYRRRVAFFTKDRYFNTSKLRNVLGYQVQYSNEEGIIQTAKWYKEQGWL